MITVVGINTAIDRRIDVTALRLGEVQRATAVQVRPGGKGLHVAQTVAALGEPVRLVGLEDAVHADSLAEHLQARGVDWRPVRMRHRLRQCLALREADGRITEVLESGEAMAEPERRTLLDQVLSLLDSSDVLVLSGSLPPGFPADTYAMLVREARARGVACLVDASGSALQLAVEASPWLVKPNADEAGTLVGRRPTDVESAVACARLLQQAGVDRPVVTLGAGGAVGLDGDDCWHARAPQVEVRNAVGSGDCFLAALAVGAVHREPLDVSLRRAAACGAANAENEEAGFVEFARVQAWMARIEVVPVCVQASASAPHIHPAGRGT